MIMSRGAGAARLIPLSVAFLACGDTAGTLEPRPRESQGEEAVADGLAVAGLLGTLSQDEIQRALEPRMGKLSRCVSQRWSVNQWLAGELELYFHVGRDGSVSSVAPVRSTFGDREAERCMVEVAAGTHFHAPHGGEAEFSWPLEVPLDESLDAPVGLDAVASREALTEPLAQLSESCPAPPGAVLTLYVDGEGKVLTAGAVAPGATAEQLDCLASAAMSWTLPPPGTAAGKVSLVLP